MKYSELASNLISKVADDSMKIVLYYKVSNRYWNIGNLKSFKSETEKALSLAIKSKEVYLVAKGNSYLGDYYKTISTKRDIAHAHYMKSARSFYNLNKNKELAEVNLKVARNLSNIGDLGRSEVYTLKALKYFYKSNDYKNEFEAICLLGYISDQLNENDEAVKYMKKAVDIAENNNLGQLSCSLAYNNLGRMLLNENAYVEALAFFQKSLKYKNLKQEDIILYSVLLENIAEIYEETKIGDGRVEELFIKSLKIKDSMQIDQVNTRIHLSQYYRRSNQMSKGYSQAQQALFYAKKGNRPHEKIAALKNLIQFNTNKEKYLSDLAKLYDMVTVDDRKLKNNLSRVEYETNEVIEEKEKAIRQKRTMLGLSIFILVVSGFIFFIRHQRTKQKQIQLQNDQQYANEEIYRLMLDQQRRFEEIRQDEKNRIARDLHDSVMNRLASTRLNLFVLSRKTDIETIEKCLPYIAEIQDIEKEIRDISQNLSLEKIVQKNKFQMLINDLIEKHRSISTMFFLVEFDELFNWDELDTKVKIHIYRIIQEVIQNAMKYSGANTISLSFKFSDNALTVDINDNGKGFKLNKVKRGMGIKNILFRGKEISAKIDIKSNKNGTKISVVIPIYL
ncbi:histidine kinase [Flavobacterium sp.]|uniref:ATP-binding protein n=1 Tax=Flavobacterium sp. TaxID=239 RepID=UPI0025C10D19|nr:histidine kinase [Flavobacterium sp.]